MRWRWEKRYADGTGNSYFGNGHCTFVCKKGSRCVWKSVNLGKAGCTFGLLSGIFRGHLFTVLLFFYLFIFKDLVFVVKYPVFVLVFILGLSLACSYIVDFIMKLLWKSALFQKLEQWGYNG